ncbi:MAG TPA: serine hydrolase domain-containing protein [Gemmatimonadales bacterium]|nr:serine hydrolase domain-containing protein [Gemmatimonadales bacterium]
MSRSAVLSTAFTALLIGPAVAQDGRAALLARVDSVVQAEMARTRTPGMSVAIQKGNDIILARGYGLANVELSVPASAETVYRIGSITKQFTAAAILQLADAGKLRLDDELTKYLPDYPVQGKKITIHHLLTHTSGIKSYTSLGPKFWNEASRLELPDTQLVALFRNEPFDFAPGEKWAYNNSGYYLLGMIIEKASGMPYRQYLKEKLLGPLGLRSTSYCDNRPIMPHRASGYEVRNGVLENDDPIGMNTPGAAGAMCSTVLDLLAWRQALFSHRVVSPASLQRMITPARLNNDSVTSYAYGLGIGKLESHRSISHGGGINGFITHLGYLPDDSLTVVVLGNLGRAPSGRVAEAIGRLLLGLELKGMRLPPPERP